MHVITYIDGVVPNIVASNVYYNTTGCLRFYPKGTEIVSFGQLSGAMTAQNFDSTVVLTDTQAYWSVLFGNLCGETWLEENVMEDDGGGDSPTANPTTPAASSSEVMIAVTVANVIALISFAIFMA